MYGTLGGTAACLRVEQMFNELMAKDPTYKYVRRKVYAMFNDHHEGLNWLRMAPPNLYQVFWNMWTKEMRNRIKTLRTCIWPPELCDHIENAIIGIARQEWRIYIVGKGLCGKKTRQKAIELIHKYNEEYDRILEEILSDED